jgi:heterodisulfide reductase subunit D
VDFTILGGEEWCCGFPLIGAGMPEKLEAMKDHNLKKVAAVGANTIVFTCPSCYHTWHHFYKSDTKLMHASQLILELIKDKKIEFKKNINGVATYHDPCDLGRNTGIYEEPREIIKAIPGLEFVELPMNRKFSVCCGGGGNVEMTDPDLSAQVAQTKLDSIKAAGADTVLTACQQCVRTMETRAKRSKSDLIVKDLTQLVVEAME